jgi:Nucleoside 2-deoxyribosyltransferase
MIEVRAFVSHSFNDADYDGGIDAFREHIDKLAASACAAVSSEGAEVGRELFFEARSAGRPLMSEIRRQIRNCDLIIADITQADDGKGPVNPNVMYEIGYGMALDKPVLVIRRNTQPLPPSDIRDLLAGSYDRIEEIPTLFLEETTRMVTETIVGASQQHARIESMIERVWFHRDVRSIAIVCAPEPEQSRFADKLDPNFVRIDRFDDRDAIVELTAFFARRYPEARVVRYLCDDLPPEEVGGNLVVLGGPGFEPGEGNSLTRELMRALGSLATYPETADAMVWDDGAPLRTELDAEGCVVTDWSAVMAAPNPENPTNRVVLLHGTNTYGTLGAALALIDTPAAMGNHLKLSTLGIAHRLTGDLNFEVPIRAEVASNRQVRTPKLEFGSIRRIES